ncbi:hypothetical protein AB205_0216700, partial [Aquarana catesbeiana]
PEIVKNLTTGNITTTSISLSWEKPDGNASVYFIQILGEPTFNRNVTTTSDTIEGLTPGNYYTFLVAAVVVPEVVKNLTAGNITTTSISLSWEKPDGNASSYFIQILGEPTFNKTVTTTSATIENLIPGNYYTFLVASVVDDNIQGEYRTVSAFAYPDVVKNPKTGNITTTSISLSWENPDGNVSSYFIQILGEPTFNTTVTTTSHTFDGLTPGNYYTFWVSALVDTNNLQGEGVYTSANTGPAPVANMKASKVDNRTIYVSWQHPEGNTSYYQIELLGDPPQNLTAATESVTIYNLTSGNQYTVRVTAVTGGDLLGDSNDIAVLDKIDRR